MNRGERDVKALSFGGVADHYERGRPGYPYEAIRWFVSQERANVVDLAAGTGKLTRRLLRLGHRVVAVEPSMAMIRRLVEGEPASWAVRAAAEAIPVRDRWADVVVAAQAFHWFDSDRALPEIRRVLQPRGRLALIWNLRDESRDWVRELSGIIGSSDAEVSGVGDSQRFGNDPLHGVISDSGLFDSMEHRVFQHDQVLDAGSLVSLVLSRSNVATLGEPERHEVVRRVQDLCARHPGLAGKETFTLPYRTHAFCTRRRE